MMKNARFSKQKIEHASKNLEAFTTYSECDSFLTGLGCHAMPCHHWHTFLVSCVESLLSFSQNDHSCMLRCVFFGAVRCHLKPIIPLNFTLLIDELCIASHLMCSLARDQLGEWVHPSMKKKMTKWWLSRNASFATHHFEILRGRSHQIHQP